MRTSGRKFVVPRVPGGALPELMLSPGVASGLRSAFVVLAELDSLESCGDRAVPGSAVLLLLSTCHDQNVTFNACAYEVNSWFARDAYNFDRLLSVLESTQWEAVRARADQLRSAAQQQAGLFDEEAETIVEEQRARAQTLDADRKGVRLSSLLQNCREYLAEFRRKDSLFHEEFDTVVGAARTHFLKNEHARILWEERFEKAGMIDGTHRPELDRRFDVLRSIECSARYLMDVVECGLVALELWTPSGPAVDSPRQLPEKTASVDQLHTELRTLQAKTFRAEVTVGLNDLSAAIGRLTARSTESEIRQFLSGCRSCFESMLRCFDLWFPVYDEHSPTPFSPSKVKFARGFTDRPLSNQFLLFLDLIKSKLAPSKVKLWVEDALGALSAECVHEATGDDSYLIVARTWDNARQIISLLRTRTELFEEPDGFGGIRVSVTKGDCVARTHQKSGTFGVMLTDREGTPDIPHVAYQLDQAKKLLASHSDLSEEDERTGVLVHSDVVLEVVGSLDAEAVASEGYIRLGEWTVKGVRGTAYFLRTP